MCRPYQAVPKMKWGSSSEIFGKKTTKASTGIQQSTMNQRQGFIISSIGAEPSRPDRYRTGAAGGVIHPRPVLTPIIAAK